jgi:hypothetical protein
LFAAKEKFTDQKWSQANYWGQAQICIKAKLETKIMARPGQYSGQANIKTRPDQY